MSTYTISPQANLCGSVAYALRIKKAAKLRAASAALNISGLELAQLQRGDWLSATPPAGYRTLSLDLQISKDFPRSVKHWTPVTSIMLPTTVSQTGTGAGPTPRTRTNWSSRLTDEPLYCHRGDRLILRDHSLDTTLGGSQVIYAEAQSQHRRQPTPPAAN